MMERNGLQRVRYRFLGHVQHRGFRFACLTCAKRVNATGWVRNERNGTVTAEVQATPEGHLAFIRELSSLVPGYGNDWSVGTEREIEVQVAENSFAVRRY